MARYAGRSDRNYVTTIQQQANRLWSPPEHRMGCSGRHNISTGQIDRCGYYRSQSKSTAWHPEYGCACTKKVRTYQTSVIRNHKGINQVSELLVRQRTARDCGRRSSSLKDRQHTCYRVRLAETRMNIALIDIGVSRCRLTSPHAGDAAKREARFEILDGSFFERTAMCLRETERSNACGMHTPNRCK